MDLLIRDFREDKTSCMETLYQIFQVLHKANVSESIQRAMLEQYTLYVDIIVSKHKGAKQQGRHARGEIEQDVPRDENNDAGGIPEITGGASTGIIGKAERLVWEIRRDLLDKQRRQSLLSSLSGESDSHARGEGESNKKKQVYQLQLLWYLAEVKAQSREVDKNRKLTRETLSTIQKDLRFAKHEIRRATSTPQTIPESEWKHIFKGEAINLDTIFSSLHHLAPPKENVGHVSTTEISLGKSDLAWKVQMSGDWTVTWHAASKATAYVFPHRTKELHQWGDYMASEFSAKYVNSHYKLIAFDRAIWGIVGGGQSIVLTDQDCFTYLYSAYLLPDGIQGGSGGRTGSSDLQVKNHSSKICRWFNSSGGCQSIASSCCYRHACLKCKQHGHGQESCTQQVWSPLWNVSKVSCNNLWDHEGSDDLNPVAMPFCLADWTEWVNPLPSVPEHELSNLEAMETIVKNSSLFKIITPINIDCFKQLLHTHPNQPFVDSVC